MLHLPWKSTRSPGAATLQALGLTAVFKQGVFGVQVHTALAGLQL